MKKAKNLKLCLITGATGGMGFPTSVALAQAGYDIFAVARSTARLSKLKKVCLLTSNGTKTFKTDLQSPRQIANLIRKITKQKKQIKWIITLAGWIDSPGSFESQKQSAIEKTFQINTLSLFQLYKGALPLLASTGGIITVASTAGLGSNPKFASYSAAKAAAINLTSSIAQLFEGTKKTAITLCPGPTNTKMRSKVARDASQHQNPDVVAQVIRDIVSKKLSYRNGDIVIVKDGKHFLANPNHGPR